jgi:hypothetical protein
LERRARVLVGFDNSNEAHNEKTSISYRNFLASNNSRLCRRSGDTARQGRQRHRRLLEADMAQLFTVVPPQCGSSNQCPFSDNQPSLKRLLRNPYPQQPPSWFSWMGGQGTVP